VRIDSHQHFWSYSGEQYPWIQADWPIKRDFLPADLEPLLEATGFNGTIAVQARQTIEESRWLLQLADESPIIKGVVGWVDLRSTEVESHLAELSQHPKFVGVRHVVQDEPDDGFMLGDAVQNGISKLKPFGLTYDILIFPKQLPAAIKLVEAFPEQAFVLDHVAKPSIKDGVIDPWRERIQELARHRNCWCKVSGMVTEANWSDWKPEDFKPYLDVVFDSFGADRLMFGSDWPVCLLAGEYERVYRLINEYVQDRLPEDQAKFFGGNAARFYCVN
jgi:L-fuconolactonase